MKILTILIKHIVYVTLQIMIHVIGTAMLYQFPFSHTNMRWLLSNYHCPYEHVIYKESMLCPVCWILWQERPIIRLSVYSTLSESPSSISSLIFHFNEWGDALFIYDCVCMCHRRFFYCMNDNTTAKKKPRGVMTTKHCMHSQLQAI